VGLIVLVGLLVDVGGRIGVDVGGGIGVDVEVGGDENALALVFEERT